MITTGGNEGDMSIWSDDDFEAALQGTPGAPAGLLALVGAVRTLAVVEPSSERARHHGAMAAAVARQVAWEGASSAAVSRTAKRRRRLVLAGVFSGFWAKAALGAVALAAVGTGAATGSLPDPIQSVVSDVAAWIGVDLPSPGDELPALPTSTTTPPQDGEDPVLTPPVSDTTATTGPPTTGPPTTAPGGSVSDDAQDQGETMSAWNACARDARAAAREAGVEPDVESACGPRPEQPGPPDGTPGNGTTPGGPGNGNDNVSPDDTNPGGGRPDDPGKPEDPGKSEDAGKPDEPPGQAER
jgi:hypothetical protein